MAKLVLQFEGRALKEWTVGLMLTIGRLPDNNVVIDNPAVSGHHACVFRDGDDFVIEDQQSKNGTFVNDKRVTRQRLCDGDVVLIGKHSLWFDKVGGADAAPEQVEPRLAALGDTVYLDTTQHRALLSTFENAGAAAAADAIVRGARPPAPDRLGLLRVLEGRALQPEYRLEGRTSLIGRSDAALVRLEGWFKPKLAVAIARNSDGYVATPLVGRTLVNSERLTERRPLKHGDVLEVGGLVLEFRLQP